MMAPFKSLFYRCPEIVRQSFNISPSLNAMMPVIHDIHRTVITDREVGWAVQALEAELASIYTGQEFSFALKNLNSVVEEVCHPYMSAGIHCDAAGIVKVSITVVAVRCAPCAEVLTV